MICTLLYRIIRNLLFLGGAISLVHVSELGSGSVSLVQKVHHVRD